MSEGLTYTGITDRTLMNPGKDFEYDMYVSRWLVKVANDILHTKESEFDYTDEERAEANKVLFDVTRHWLKTSKKIILTRSQRRSIGRNHLERRVRYERLLYSERWRL